MLDINGDVNTFNVKHVCAHAHAHTATQSTAECRQHNNSKYAMWKLFIYTKITQIFNEY